MMARYIDAELLRELIDFGLDVDFDEVPETKQALLDMIDYQETADVAPVIHAHWVRWKEPKVTNPVYRCSNCDFDITVDKHPNVSIGFWISDFRYCLHCGAKMDEEVENG